MLLGDCNFRAKCGLTHHVARCLEVTGMSSVADGVSKVAKHEVMRKRASQSLLRAMLWDVAPSDGVPIVGFVRAVGWAIVIEAVMLYAAGRGWWEVPEMALLVAIMVTRTLWGLLGLLRVEQELKGAAVLSEAPRCGLV